MKAENSRINRSQNLSSPTFKGYVGTKAERGKEFLKFYPPVYKKAEGDKIYLEFCALKRGTGRDVEGKIDATAWVFDDSVSPKLIEETGDLFASNSSVSISRDFGYFKNQVFKDNNSALGYRYVVKDKDGNIKEYLNDFSGVKTQNDNNHVYNVITENQSVPLMSGPIYHMFFNSFAPETTTKEDMPNRNHFNDADTTIKSVIGKLNDGTLDPYKLILSTPVFGKDEVSSNGYWTTNPYQISSKIGTKDDFMSLQSALFDKGKAWIADGAFTSQGYQSPLVQNVLKHGNNSPFKHWLKIDSKPTLGVLPDSEQTDPENLKHIKYRLVNSPYQNKSYKPFKPTYIQFYDDRLVSRNQLDNKDAIIERYAKQMPELDDGTLDPYAISTHQDSVQHYFFEIDASDTQKMKNLTLYEGKSFDDLKNVPVTDLLDFGNFKIGEKNSASGANFWDGQVDLIKMNLSGCDNSDESRAGMVQARNYLYGCATYWTKATNNALVAHTAQLLSKDENSEIEKIKKSFNLDDSTVNRIKKNIDNGSYQFSILNSKLGVNPNDNINDFILNEIVDFPLESIEFSPEITGIIASPYFSARPTMIEYQNASKLDMVRGTYKGADEKIYADFAKTNSKMNELYMGKIYDFTMNVLSEIDTPEPIFNDGTSELTDYGKFVVKQIVPDIVKFGIVNSLFGDNDVDFDIDNGKINYNIKSLKQETLASLKQDTPESEAENLIKEINKGFSSSVFESKKDDLIQTLSNKLSGVKLSDYKLAQALVDETGAGLNWRFDAAKDIADNNQLYDGNNTYDNIFEQSIDFWKNFVSNIKCENSNSYTIGEVTDLYHFIQGSYSGIDGDNDEERKKNGGRFSEDRTAQRMFVEETGMTTLTNYAYMYAAIPGLLSVMSDDGSDTKYGDMGSFSQNLNYFLASGPLSMINYSHVATGNHDKPRAMHAMALDMNIFGFDNKQEHSEQEISNFKDTIAYVTGEPKESIDYNKYSSSGIAVGARLKGILLSDDIQLNSDYKNFICQAISDLSQGKYIGHDEPNLRRAAAFGNDDIRASLSNIIDYAIYLEKQAGKDSKEIEKLANEKSSIVSRVMAKVLEKPMKEELRIWQLMNAISGNPTLYAGDEYAQTGYETPSKNVYVKNRGIVDHDIIKESGNQKVKDYNKHMKAIAQIHDIKGLSALSGGTLSHLFGVWCGDKWPDGMMSRCFVNNDEKGSMTFTVITPFFGREDNNDLIGKKEEKNEKIIPKRWQDNLEREPKETRRIELFTLDDKYSVSSALTPGMKLGRVIYNKEKGTYEPDSKTYKLAVHNSKYYIEDTSGEPIKINEMATYFYKI